MTETLLVRGDTAAMHGIAVSLPLSLRLAADDIEGAVAAVRGGTGWPAAVATQLGSGASAAVVDDPRPVDLDELLPLRSSSGSLLLQRGYASNPAIPPALAAWTEAGAHATLVDSQIVLRSSRDARWALLRHVALVRAVAGPIDAVAAARFDHNGYAVAARLCDGTKANLVGAVTAAGLEHARVRLLGAPHRMWMDLYPTATARPTAVRLLDGAGERTLPTIYETAPRALWREAAVRLQQPCADLADFEADLRVVDEAIREAGR